MDNPKSEKLAIIIPAYRMHTQTFLSVLAEISEIDAKKRIDGITNHMIWMAGNFINMRYCIAQVLELEEKDPYHDLFYMGKALDENLDYPNLKDLLTNFHKISPRIYHGLLHLHDEQLSEPFHVGMDIPFIQEDKLNFIGMCIGRADYLSGQLALMRRILGYPSMHYGIDDNIQY